MDVARDDNAAEPATGAWPLTTGEKERFRLVAQGTRTDTGEVCSLVVVAEVGGTWAWYPHGAAQFGVRLAQPEAARVAQSIVDGAR